MGESRKIAVGDWSILPARNLLERAGRSVRIKPRSMEVLVYLARHAGEVVSPEELLEAVWQGRVVSDGTVYQHITKLRRAFGDSAGEARVIETIPKRGYRLVAPVKDVEATADLGTDIAGRSRKLAFAAVGFLALVLGLGYVVWRSEQPVDAGRELLPSSVAVLPLENLSPDPDHANFAAGIHASIINRLGLIGGLSVISRSSVMQYDGVRVSEIANDLGVGTVLEGSVHYDGERVLINVELIDGMTEAQVWADAYEGDLSDIFAFQADIATHIANALEIELSPAEQEGIEQSPTKSPEAYALYLEALALPPSQVLRLRYLDRVISLDPEFAHPYAHKALRYAIRGRELSEEWETIARDAATRALELDPKLGLAHAALAFLHQSKSQGTEAEQAFQRAIELEPNDADVLEAYSRFKRYRGEYAEAVRVAERATALDPNNPTHQYQLGIAFRYARNFDAAAKALTSVLVARPTFSPLHLQLGITETARGNYAEAIRHLQVCEELLPATAPVSRLAQLASAYADLDREEDVRRLFDEIREKANDNPASDAVWAQAYMALGDYDQALEHLEAAMDDPTRDIIRLAGIKADIYGDPELDRPELRAVLDRLWDAPE